MRWTRSGFCSAHFPVMPKVAFTPVPRSVSRICAAKPRSAPASNVRATIRRDAGPRETLIAFAPGTAVAGAFVAVGAGGLVAVAARGFVAVAVGGLGGATVDVGVGEGGAVAM